MIQIAPSILAADFLRLGEHLTAAERGGASRLHFDVMDGRFVPNISFGIPLLHALRPATRLPIEVHLMIEEPERLIDAFARAGGDTIVVHQETCPHLDRTLHQIRELGKRAGVSLNPSTPASTLDEVLEIPDLILVMTVNPGFGGQHFIEYTTAKMRRLRDALDRRNPRCDLEVDGGIDVTTAPRVVEAGANVLVAGTSVFGHPGGPEAGIAALLESAGGR